MADPIRTSSELSKTLRYQIRVRTSPNLPDHLGECEVWLIQVFDVRCGSTKWPSEITTLLEYIEVPDRWDGFTLIPAHRKTIPGVKFNPDTGPTLTALKERARNRALTLSGYMSKERVTLWEESTFDLRGHPQKAPKGVLT